jgi:hypothetical protein
VIVSPAGLMVKTKPLLALAEALSVTSTVIVYVPCVAGVPLIVAPDAVNPWGRDAIVHVYGGVPPAATKVSGP